MGTSCLEAAMVREGLVERDATQAFLGSFTSHTRTAREMMKDLSVAIVRIGVDVVELL